MINRDTFFKALYSCEDYVEIQPQFYIYVRLYKSAYKSAFNPAQLIDKGIQIIDEKVITSNGNSVGYFNHATMNTSLKDNFLGLTIAKGDKPDLRPEIIGKASTSNNYIQSCDRNKSQYSVYALSCTDKDYENVCNLLNQQTKYNLTDYSAKQNAIIALSRISYNIINLFKRKKQKSREDFNDLDKHTGLVCSTFVMNVLYHCVNKVHKLVDNKNFFINLFTPNDIVNKIPGMKFCFGGTFNTYLQDCSNFIKLHPEHGALL